MANLPWFRMYAEFATDAKVQSMPEVMQRRLVMMFCLRCSDVTVTLSDEELAFQLRISEEELAETKALFIRKGFIDETWEVLNWEKRQFASDSSAERTRAWRERQKQGKNDSVTSQEQPRDGLDTDTDKKQKRKASCAEPQSDSTPEVIRIPVSGGEEFAVRQSRVDEWEQAYPAVDIVRQLAAMRQWCLANPRRQKTARGVLAFCNNWLHKEQNSPRSAQARASPGAWWATDQSVVTKGAEMGMAPRAGEGMPAFKGRVQAAIDNGGVEPRPPRQQMVTAADMDGPRGMKPAGLDLKALVRPRAET